MSLSAKERTEQLHEVNEVVRRVLKDFVGRTPTPLLLAEAERCVRETLVGLILSGKYVLPAGVEFDRVEMSEDLKIQVYFKRSTKGIVES